MVELSISSSLKELNRSMGNSHQENSNGFSRNKRLESWPVFAKFFLKYYFCLTYVFCLFDYMKPIDDMQNEKDYVNHYNVFLHVHWCEKIC